jgi:hypothetical protein
MWSMVLRHIVRNMAHSSKPVLAAATVAAATAAAATAAAAAAPERATMAKRKLQE